MWIRPSMPSRSTKAPKSTMLEILPSTTWPGSSRPRICSRTSLRSSSSTARRESTTLLRERLSSITLHSSFWPMNSSRFWTRRMSTSEAGRKPRTPEVEDQAALDDLDHGALHRLAGVGGLLDPAPGLLEAGALLGEDQAPLLVLLGEDERVHLLAELDLLGRLHRLADRELVGGDDALGLVADVDQYLVLVDAHDLAADHVALAEGVDGRVVVGDELAVDLDQEVVGGAAPFPAVCGCSACCSGVACPASVVVSTSGTAAQCGRHMRHAWTSRPGFVYLCRRCPGVRRSGATSAPR